MTITAHNVEVGRPPRAVVRSVRSLIADTDSRVVCLFEAGRYSGALRDSFSDGWRVLVARDAIVLVRKDVPMRNVRRPRHNVPWVGPKAGVPHEGREWIRVDVELGGQRVRVLAVHRVPGGPGKPNTNEAWVRENQILTRQATRATEQGIPLLVLGDINDHTDNSHPLSHRSMTARTGGRIIRTGCAVDWATSYDLRTDAERLGFYGSDHPAVRYDVRTNK